MADYQAQSDRFPQTKGADRTRGIQEQLDNLSIEIAELESIPGRIEESLKFFTLPCYGEESVPNEDVTPEMSELGRILYALTNRVRKIRKAIDVQLNQIDQ